MLFRKKKILFSFSFSLFALLMFFLSSSKAQQAQSSFRNTDSPFGPSSIGVQMQNFDSKSEPYMQFQFSTQPKSQAAADAASVGKTTVASNEPPTNFPVEIEIACNELMLVPNSYNTQAILQPLCTSASNDARSCNDSYIPAGEICHPDKNSDLMQKTLMIQGLLSSAQGVMESCSTFSKAMDIGKLAMTAYSVACGAKRQICESACGKSKASNEALLKGISNIVMCPEITTSYDAPPTVCIANAAIRSKAIALIQKENGTTPATVGGKLNTCQVAMMDLIGMGLANIVALVQSKNMSDQCEKDTKSNASTTAVDCTKSENSTKTECATTVVDCGLVVNADKSVCICKDNPRIKGCEGISTALAVNSTLSSGGLGSVSGKGLNLGAAVGTQSATDKKFPSDMTANTSKNDGSRSGIGGASDTGLTENSNGKSDADSQYSKTNTAGSANILGAESGGGGYRFGGTAASEKKGRGIANSVGRLKKLSAMEWSSQVTSQAGKTNFDKIKVRYNENRTSLLNK